MGLEWAQTVQNWAQNVQNWSQRPNFIPKLQNFYYSRVLLVKYDIILNFIKICGYLCDGPRLGPKGLELGPKCLELVPKAKYHTRTIKLFIIISCIAKI